MFSIEKKAWQLIRRHMLALLLAAGVLLSAWVRFAARGYVSWDMTHAFLPWHEQFRAGGLAALKTGVGDYSLAYQFFIAVMAQLPINPVYGYKVFSILFDYLLAAAVGYLAYMLTGSRNKGGAACLITLFLPMVWLNSAAWGQCDAIYVFFCVLSVIFLLKQRPIACFIAYGAALAFKLQAVFLLPFLLFAYAFTGKFSLAHFLLSPAVMLVSGLPAFLMGRPLVDLFRIYAAQTRYSPMASLSYPSFWTLMTPIRYAENYAIFHAAGISLAVISLALMMWCVFIHRQSLERGELLALSFLFAYACVFFLPNMHERYDYLPIILCLTLVLAKPQMLPILLGLVYINLRTYSDLFAMPKNWLGLSVVNAVCFALSAAVILRDIARTAKD